ncbi:MAG: arsenic efflux protein [Lachnospiraceae bacterium]|nr:arsenic efflux protein [Lachnospiraceae bacterium]
MLDVISDSLIDSLKLLPFLFLSYLAVEYIKHRMSARTKEWIYRAGKAGPLIGSLIGIIPQCGFSAAAAGLFAAKVVSPGTLIAVFLSTSDEMLPIMLSEGIPVFTLFRVLAAKAAAGTVIGILVDFAAAKLNLWKNEFAEPLRIRPAQTAADQDKGAIQKMCEHGHCHCREQGIFRAAVYHTAQTILFIFLVSLLLGFGMDWFGGTAFSRGVFAAPGAQAALAALIGMIPNCAASVLITQLYLEGVLSSASLFAGLLCGAGTGLLVLFREDENRKECLIIMATLYASGLLAGVLLGSLGILS